MKKIVILTLMPFMAFASVESELEEMIRECMICRQVLTPYCSMDGYTYFYLLGLQKGYEDCLKLIEENTKCH